MMSFYSTSGIYLAYKFIILNITTNKIIFMVFLKCRPSSHSFNKLVTRSKNACTKQNDYF